MYICQEGSYSILNRFLNIALGALLLTTPLMAEGGLGTMQDSLVARFNTYATWCSPEKVYLHYDRSCYTAGETVWFKGWSQEASGCSALPPSNFIYVEVLDNHGETVARVKIKRSNDGFPGCMELPDYLETGDYTIRAYSLWQLNNGPDYLFNDRIRIIGGTGKKERPPKRSDNTDISFWPEGGRYFAGHKAVIGFKAVDGQGRSVELSGALVNDTDEDEEQVVTVHDGMGVFAFLPKPGYRYSVRDASGKLYPLPAPAEEGGSIQMMIRSGRYYVQALGFGGGNACLLLRDSSELYPLAEIGLDGNPATIMMESSFFRPGINHLLLVDSHGRIMAERLFFVRAKDTSVCRIRMDSFPAAPRALVEGSISLTRPDGTPMNGNCSISVVMAALKDWQQSDGITSYMGLSSELKGRINNPYYYFDPDIPEHERDAALDMLMMIQGWRYYDLDGITGLKDVKLRLKYLRERVQELRGHISRRLSSRMPKDFTLTFMIPQQNVMHSVEVEQGRRFIIDSLDFPENTEMLINIGSSRLFSHYLPKWDGDPSAAPYIYKPAPGFARASAAAAPTLPQAAPGDTLEAAVVSATYGDDVLVFGKSYREDLRTFKDMTLVEYLSMTKAMFEYDGEHMYNRNRRRSRSAGDDDSDGDSDEENDSGRVLLIVDDSEEAWWSFDMLRLEDLRALSVSTRPDPVYGGDGGVVHISVKPGGVRRGDERNPSLLYFVPLGYQVPRYFESPRYDRGDNVLHDARNTIWWSPDVAIDNGRAAIEFCNSDRADYPYIIRIEGVDADGNPFSCHRRIAPE